MAQSADSKTKEVTHEIWSGQNATTTSTAYVDLPGMAVTFATTGTTPTLLDIRFGSESRCTGPVGGGDWCSVQILVDGVLADPSSCSLGAINFAYDATDNGRSTSSNWQARAIE